MLDPMTNTSKNQLISSMDIPRAKTVLARHRIIILVGLAVLVIVGVTVVLSQIKAAAPSVDRSTVWIDTVKRGEMLRQVQGPGVLVPEQIRWISAVTSARVERIAVEPGVKVNKDTILLVLSNPDLKLQALEAQRQVATESAGLANLQANQRSQQLAQQSLLSTLRSEMNQAKRQATADKALANRGFLSDLEMAQSEGKAKELENRLDFEQKRLAALADGMAAQLSAGRAQIERLRSIAEFRRHEADALTIRAGVDGVLQELPLQVGQWVSPGTLLAKVAQPDRLKAEIRIAEVQAKDVQVGQSVMIDTRNGIITGIVARIEPVVQAGSVKVDVTLKGTLPKGARPDLSIQGTVEIEHLDNIIFVGRPAFGNSESTISIFKLTLDGTHALRVAAVLGKSSVQTVEIISGLKEGDQVILSDMSRWDSTERIRLQ